MAGLDGEVTVIDTARVLRYGYRYHIKDEANWIDGDLWSFAEPVSYADGAESGDCRIVDQNGNVYPDVPLYPLAASALEKPCLIDSIP